MKSTIKFKATFYRLSDEGVTDVYEYFEIDSFIALIDIVECANLLAENEAFDMAASPNRVKITCQQEGTNNEQLVVSGNVTMAWGKVIYVDWVMPIYEETARTVIEDTLKIVEQEIGHHAQWSKQDANPLIDCADRLSMCLGSPDFQSEVNYIKAIMEQRDLFN